MLPLKAPFPYYGGKSIIAAEVWRRLGDVPNYVEPFFGSGAVLLARPHEPQLETANDYDGMVSNFWRALQADPDAVAHYADWPVNENDLTARHIWLVNRKESMQQRLEGDPAWYDVQAAGWWVWGISCWIGSGWCSGNGAWNSADGVLVNTGQGVARQRVHLGNTRQGVNRKRMNISGHYGMPGVLRNSLRNGDGDSQREKSRTALTEYMRKLADRLRLVRMCCGDFERVLGPSVTYLNSLTGVFLDPPYSADANRSIGLYATDSGDVAHRARRWCIENGDNPLLRICLAGYELEHDELEQHGWSVYTWQTGGGYANQGNGDTQGAINGDRERLWFSPFCLQAEQLRMF